MMANSENKKARTTKEVLKSHLTYRATGNVDNDLRDNFSSDVVLLTNKGKFYGHEGIRYFQQILAKETHNEDYHYPVKLIDGPYAYIEWRTNDNTKFVADGADSFVIQDGQIIMQTIRYTLKDSSYVLVPLDHLIEEPD